MFKIDPVSNHINPLEVKRFSDLGCSECEDLQEWLENPRLTLAQCNGQRPVVSRSHIQR